MSDLGLISCRPSRAKRIKAPAALSRYPGDCFAVESPLANVCDTNYTSIAKMPERCLRKPAFAGIHEHLGELAASL